jgi:plasmid stabilization system protein ParE
LTSDNPLGDAVLLLLEYLRNSHSDEERKLIEVAGGAVAFLSTSGQLYRFEDFRKGVRPGPVRSFSFADVIHHLEQRRAQARSTEVEETLEAAIDALVFIESSGQHEGLEPTFRRSRIWFRVILQSNISRLRRRMANVLEVV